MNTKSLFASKTVILNMIAALAMVYPPAAAGGVAALWS
jgi:hypothetical protein